MQVVHPILLWALLLGLIPIIIYYLMRFRSLRVDWGANYVLERALERLRKKLYLDQVILLALRVLAVMLIVLAFARPLLRARRETTGGSRIHRVIVVDGSYSMLAASNGKTAWDASRDTLRQLVSSWGRGERWSLYLLSGTPRWVVEDEAVETPEKSVAVIDGLTIDESAASLATALETVVATCGSEPCEIYIAADDQAATWADIEAVDLSGAAGLRVFWISPARDDHENCAVTRVTVSHEKILRDHPCRVFVQVRNFGLRAVEEADLDLLIDGTFFRSEPVSLLPGQEVSVHGDIYIGAGGSHVVTARLQSDVLTFDNEMSAGLHVVESLSVLALRDAAPGDKFASASGFLQLAGEVMQRDDEDGRPLFPAGRVQVTVSDRDDPGPELAAADAVVVDGGRSLSAELAGLLADYVAGGGALVLAADDGVVVSEWNERLGGVGLLPAELERPRFELLGGEQYRSIAAARVAPGFRSLATREDGDAGNLKFYSWMTMRPDGDAEVLLSFDDGTPYVVRKRVGRGTVLLVAAGLGPRNNNLLVREVAYPFLVNLFSTAAAAGFYPRTVARGEAVRAVLGEAAATAVQFESADGATRAVEPTRDGENWVASVAGGASRSGRASLLVVHGDTHERIWFGVQGPRSDSDLAAVDEAAVAGLGERVDLVRASDWDELDEALRATRRGAELHHWFMLAVLAALVGEMLMELRFV